MTTAAGGASAEKTLFERVALWAHHHDGYIWTAYVWSGVFVGVATSASPVWSPLTLIPWLPWAFIPVSWIGDRLHMRKFWDCSFCHERQPLDAPAQGEHYRQTLINRHNMRRWLIMGVLALLATLAVPIVGVPLLGKVAGAFALVPIWAMLLYVSWATRKHDQLQPWCPICRRRDEGDDPIDIPAPTPPGARVEA